jgi:enamidase
MPLGVLYTIAHLSSLAAIEPEVAIAAATGNNARSFRLDCGLLSAGKAADIVLIDAPDGGTQHDALSAIRNGDIAAVGAVISAGAVRREEPQHPRHHASHPRRILPALTRPLRR